MVVILGPYDKTGFELHEVLQTVNVLSLSTYIELFVSSTTLCVIGRNVVEDVQSTNGHGCNGFVTMLLDLMD